eukprot:TRINITY_DN8025_c0_g1_i4.p1 TRINITY_DN8025_c0_g1~~TRINITY_DN8025_c0_g1_i4.p1  ORF type:complete len:691 (-),score=94.72 TRINITY_DN8025_c0_g1_i4:232-2304(-)
MDAEVTVQEIRLAVKGLKNGKSPGPDGITMEVWKKLDFLDQALLEVWQAAHTEGVLPHSSRLGLLSAFPKKPPFNTLSNYRPITLTNTDYKIWATVFANRLKRVIRDVVGPSQSGCIPRRDIRGNIAQAEIFLRRGTLNDRLWALILLDLEKAFDRLNRLYMLDTFRHLGFGPAFIRALATLHEHSRIFVRINGFFTDLIDADSGVKQGCPIAPLLYAVATEPLRALLDNIRYLAGVYVHRTRVTSSHYADDTAVAVSTLRHLTTLHKLLELFEKGAAQRANLTKSAIFFTSQLPTFPHAPLPLVPFGESDRYLGHMLGIVTPETQWAPTVAKFLTACAQWKSRTCSILGKAVGVRVFIAPIIEFISSTTPLLPRTRKTMQTAMWKVIFAMPRSRVRYEFMHKPRSSGGLGIPCLESRALANLARWYSRVQNAEPGASWATLFTQEATYILDEIGEPGDIWSGPPLKQLRKAGLVGNAIYAWRYALSLNDNLSHVSSLKDIYVTLMGGFNTPCRIACAPSLEDDDRLRDRWHALHRCPVAPRAIALRWRAWHNKLLLKRDPPHSNNILPCPICHDDNSGLHILLHCPTAIAVRDVVRVAVEPAIPLDMWNEDWIHLDEPEEVVTALDTVMTLTKASIWYNYTAHTYGNKPLLPAPTIVKAVHAKISRTAAALALQPQSRTGTRHSPRHVE